MSIEHITSATIWLARYLEEQPNPPLNDTKKPYLVFLWAAMEVSESEFTSREQLGATCWSWHLHQRSRPAPGLVRLLE